MRQSPPQRPKINTTRPLHEPAPAEHRRERPEQGVDVLLLSIGDPDFDTPQPIVQAAIDSLQAGDTHYPDVCGAIISAVDRRWTQTMSSCFRGRNARCTRSRNACSIRAIR